jgi:hypothetical protein
VAIFEVGKEYWVTYGPTEDQSFASAKVLGIEGQWLHIESDKLDSHINLAAPWFISARERNRAAEEKFKVSQVVFVGRDGEETGRMDVSGDGEQ